MVPTVFFDVCKVLNWQIGAKVEEKSGQNFVRTTVLGMRRIGYQSYDGIRWAFYI